MSATTQRRRPRLLTSFALLIVVVVVVRVVLYFLLPLLQRSAYTPPAPMGQLPPWSLRTPASEPVAPLLDGKVAILTFVPQPCPKACVAEHRALIDDLHPGLDVSESVRLVTVAPQQTAGTLGAIDGGADWLVATGAPGELEGPLRAIREAWLATDGGAATSAPGVVLVDQQRAIRGVWADGVTGRTNATQAARLLVEQGP